MGTFFSNLVGTLEAAFQVGSSAASGLRRLRFRNSAGTIDIDATPTGTHTITAPSRTGTMLVRDGSGNIGGGSIADLSSLGLTGSIGTSASLIITSNTAAGTSGFFRLNSDGLPRWDFGKLNDAESGSNAGSSLYVARFSDAGGYLGAPIIINRATGTTTLEGLSTGSATVTGNTISIGNPGTTGARTLSLANSAGSITFTGTPTGTRTITVPDSTGTIRLTADEVPIEIVTPSYSVYAANYTLVAADRGRSIHFDGTGVVTLTIPTDASVPFPIGTTIQISVRAYVVVLDASAVSLINYSGGPSQVLLRGLQYRLFKRTATTWELRSGSFDSPYIQEYSEDFIGGANFPSWLATSLSGGSVAATTSTIDVSNPGAISLSSGTGTSDYAAISTASNQIVLTTGIPYFYSVKVQASSAPDGTNNYSFRAGFHNTLTSATSAGAFFRCISGENSALIRCISRTASVETAVDTAIAITAYNTLELLLIPGTLARFWINGNQVANITSNLPPNNTGAVATTGIFKTAGTSNRQLFLNRKQIFIGT